MIMTNDFSRPSSDGDFLLERRQIRTHSDLINFIVKENDSLNVFDLEEKKSERDSFSRMASS